MREASETDRFGEGVDTASASASALLTPEQSDSPGSHNLRPLLLRTIRLLRNRRHTVPSQPVRPLRIVSQSLVRSHVEMHLQLVQVRADKRAPRLARRHRLLLAEDDRSQRVEALRS